MASKRTIFAGSQVHMDPALSKVSASFPRKLLLAIVCLVLLNIFTAPQYLQIYDLAWLHIHSLHFLPPYEIGQFIQAHAVVAPLNIIRTRAGSLLFTLSFCIVFVLYFWGLVRLPGQISYRFIQRSTLLLGCVYMLVPVVTSQDIISYIAYTRMVVVYHLNPFVITPHAIQRDYVYHFLYWVNQPSAYGPVWLGLSSGVQWIAWQVGARHVLSMELLLRVFALLVFLGSIHLVWLLSGRLLEERVDIEAPSVYRQRICATLAFAWSPFLLLEAAVNAHNDIMILFLLLLALWFLFPGAHGRRHYEITAVLFALAIGIKVTYILLLPGLVLFLLLEQTDVKKSLLRRMYDAGLAGLIAIGLIVAIHAPFWNHGLLLNILRVNPSSSRDINSFYELGVSIYTLVAHASLRYTMDRGSYPEIVSHYISAALFFAGYLVCCLATVIRPRYINTPPALLGWLVFVWLFYCLVGDPWFWPWYLVVVFGLLALLEVMQGVKETQQFPCILNVHLNIAWFSRILMIAMFGIYVLWNFL